MPMKLTHKNYFFHLAIFGLLMEVLVSWFILGPVLFESLSFSGGTSVVIQAVSGIVMTLLTSLYFDKKTSIQMHPRKTLIIAGPVIFISGVMVAVIVNLFVLGNIFNPIYSISNELRSWVFKPFFWLIVIGAPMSVLVGGFFRIIYTRVFPKLKPL
jgi:hypothetical protein